MQSFAGGHGERTLPSRYRLAILLMTGHIVSSNHTRSPSFRNRSATARTTALSFQLWLRKTSYVNSTAINRFTHERSVRVARLQPRCICAENGREPEHL